MRRHYSHMRHSALENWRHLMEYLDNSVWITHYLWDIELDLVFSCHNTSQAADKYFLGEANGFADSLILLVSHSPHSGISCGFLD